MTDLEMAELDVIDVVVPISAIEHFAYCPRQCALIHVEQTFDENVYTLRGRTAHERVDDPADHVGRGSVRVRRGLVLWSDVLGLYGKADVVEFRPDPYPIEYKIGSSFPQPAKLQLCAQALCLEEMLGKAVPAGALLHIRQHRRTEVQFTDELRQATKAVIDAVRQQLAEQRLPSAQFDRRCKRCSLLDACLPEVLTNRHRLRGLQGALYTLRNEEGSDAGT